MSLLDNLGLFVLSAEGWIPENGNVDRWLNAINVGIIVFGAFFVLNAFMPATFAIKNSKNTIGVNRLMFFLHSSVAFMFFIGAWLLMIAMGVKVGKSGNNGNGNTPGNVAGLATGIILVLLNGTCLCGNSFITLLKTKNSASAKKLGISEADYYRDYISKEIAKR